MGKSKKAVERRVEPLVVRLISWATRHTGGNQRVKSYSVAHLATPEELTRANDPRNNAITLCGLKIPRYTNWLMDADTRGRNKCSACQWLSKHHGDEIRQLEHNTERHAPSGAR